MKELETMLCQDTLRRGCELKDGLLLYIHAVFQDTLRSERELKVYCGISDVPIFAIRSVASAS